MKRLLIALIALTISFCIQAQNKIDTIFLTSGEEVLALVKEISPNEIKYKTASNPDGPMFVMPKSKIKSITFSNGVIEQYSNTPVSRPIASTSRTSSSINDYKGREFDDPNANSYDFSDRLLNETPLVYYGIDFTLVKFIGSSGFNDPAHIVDVYFDKINQKIVMEQDKYDMGILFRRKDYDIDLAMLSGRNRAVNPYDVVINSNHSLSEQDIDYLVSTYNPKQQEGIGLVIVMEALNKLRETGVMYFAFFDIKTKDVVYIYKASGEPSGFGITNYWMKPVYNALKSSKRHFRSK